MLQKSPFWRSLKCRCYLYLSEKHGERFREIPVITSLLLYVDGFQSIDG